MAKTLTGIVSSTAPNKTITVSVHTRKTHLLYKKQYPVTTKFMAHDEKNECKVGDKVTVIETKPISARKRFKLEKILERAKLTDKDKQILKAEPEVEEPAEEDAK